MNYKIHTAPILDAYRDAPGCPFCALERQKEESLLKTYVGAGVMSPELRVEVNKVGFCKTHFEKLFASENPLGLALQSMTRIETLQAQLPRPNGGKAASRAAAAWAQSQSHCVICDQTEETMQRYYETTAALFGDNIGFEPSFKKCKGYCSKHYGELLARAKFARNRAAAYLDGLYDVQQRALAKLHSDLEQFTFLYDATKPDKNRVDDVLNALDRAIKLLPSDG